VGGSRPVHRGRLARGVTAHRRLVTALVLGWVAASGEGCRQTGSGPTCRRDGPDHGGSLPEAAQTG
jgi:hypothetical protein